jgi:hypothetical protein
MGLSDSAVRTISDIAHTVHKSAQLMSNLGVTAVTKSWSDRVGNIERMLPTQIKDQNQQNLHITGVVTEENARS